MGFTFDTDFFLLNQALGQTASMTFTSPTNSILTPEERAQLLDVVTLVEELRGKFSEENTQWLTVPSGNREAVADALIRPALYLGLRASYVLEVVSTYAVHQCSGSKRSLSFISQSKPRFYGIFRRLTFLGPFNLAVYCLTQELWAHARIIDTATPNEEVRIVLRTAIHIYQKEVLGIKNVSGTDSILEYGEWADLKKASISKDEEKQFEYARWHRGNNEARQRVESDSLRYSAQV
jgi:hypothetical protein